MYNFQKEKCFKFNKKMYIDVSSSVFKKDFEHVHVSSFMFTTF